MVGGALAVVFAVTGLPDMLMNYCPDSCLPRSDAQARASVQLSDVILSDETIAREIYLSYDHATRYGPFQPTAGLSFTDEGAIWIGIGAKWTATADRFFFEASLLPGLTARGDGPDLGGIVHFRSAIAVGYLFDSDATLALTLDHRSNGDLFETNPGMDTVGIRYSIVLD